MDTRWTGPVQNRDKDDDVPADPKTGGLDRPGAGKDDDVPADPKTGGLERPGA